MSLADDLLRQARFLAELNAGLLPNQADLRRAVSSAYYAVFHLLSAASAAQVSAGLPFEVGAKTQRGLDHKQMYAVAGAFAKPGVNKIDAKAILLPASISTKLADIAEGFRTLQDQRHIADYDVLKSFDRIKVLELVTSAEGVFLDWDAEQASPNAHIFLAALALWKSWRE
jgi:uncharacterized protein (UPF0332 family)